MLGDSYINQFFQDLRKTGKYGYWPIVAKLLCATGFKYWPDFGDFEFLRDNTKLKRSRTKYGLGDE